MTREELIEAVKKRIGPINPQMPLCVYEVIDALNDLYQAKHGRDVTELFKAPKE